MCDFRRESAKCSKTDIDRQSRDRHRPRPYQEEKEHRADDAASVSAAGFHRKARHYGVNGRHGPDGTALLISVSITATELSTK